MLDCKDSKSVLSSELIYDLNNYILYKDSYCIVYCGGCTEYIFILNNLKQNFLDAFPNLSITVCCKQAILNKLVEFDKEFIKPIETTNIKKYGCIEEIKCNLLDKTHPLEKIIQTLNIRKKSFIVPSSNIKTVKISANGTFPIKSLNPYQIESTKKYLIGKKSIKIIENDTDTADWIIGVENYETHYHASKGLKTTFVNVDLGENLIKTLYENVEFWNIGHK